MRLLYLALLPGTFVWAADPYCPAYPPMQREIARSRLALERSSYRYSLRADKTAVRQTISNVNLIDDYILGKMAADGVPTAPLTTDAEFLRRVTIDLTGRVPAPELAAEFINSTDGSKRAALVESLAGSDAFVDNWTMFYSNLYEITSGYYNFISVDSRNLFYRTVRDFVQALGATPVGVPPTEIAEQLSKGTIDGAFIDYGGAGIAFKMGGLLKYSTEMYSYISSFAVVMNQDFWNKLSPDLQALVTKSDRKSVV